MQNLLLWVLVTFGVTLGITVSDIFKPVRKLFTNSLQCCGEEEENNSKIKAFIGTLLKCPMCVGFWVGLFSGIFWFSPTSYVVADAFLCSATCWILHKYFSRAF